MNKNTQHDIERRLDERLSNWQTPFDANQPERAKARIMAAIDTNSTTTLSKSTSSIWWKVAAGVALILSIAGLLQITGKTEVQNLGANQLAYSLPDGSVVTLNPEGSLTYNRFFWPIKRQLQFEGEGFFEVESGSTFDVETSKGTVSVVGTKFSIWADDNDLLVHCSHGKVRVYDPKSEVILEAHQFTHLQDAGLAPLQTMEHNGFYAPRKNFDALTFENTPLSAVIQELELVLGTEIKCKMDIGDLTYSGVIGPKDLTTCFEVLCKPFGAKYERSSDGIFVIYE